MRKYAIASLLATLCALQFSGLSGQVTRVPAGDPRKMHEEKIEDPYLPNAYGNQRTTPAYHYGLTLKSGSGTSVTTVQVNVNGGGQNIVGDAANEPNIAINPLDPNKMVIGWRQFDNVASNFRQAGWGYTLDGGHNWTFPGVIEPGIFRSDPVLDFDVDGVFYYNSLTNDPNYFCKVFVSTNGGISWDGGTDAHGGDKQWMAIDRSADAGRGNINAFWSYFFSTCSPGFATRSTDMNRSYEDCFVIEGSPYWGTMAYGNAGELYVGGVGSSADSLLVAKSVNAKYRDSVLTWSQVVKLNIDGNAWGWAGVNPGGLLGQVSIDVDHSTGPGRNNVYVLATLARKSTGDPCDVLFARSTDGGRTWGAPMRINDDQSNANYQWFGTMSVSPTGRIDAAWLDTRDAQAGTDSSALYYSYSMDQGKTWSRNEKLSAKFDPHVGYPNQNKIGDYIDMVSDSTGAHLAWAATFNGEQDVYYSHIVPYRSTGIDETQAGTKIRIYPNPTGNKLLISGLTPGIKIDLMNAAGTRLQTIIPDGTTCRIDLSARPSGLYFLKITGKNGETVVEKIVRE